MARCVIAAIACVLVLAGCCACTWPWSQATPTYPSSGTLVTLTSTPSGNPLTNYGTRIEVAVDGSATITAVPDIPVEGRGVPCVQFTVSQADVESIESTITRADFASLAQDLSQDGVMGGTEESIEVHYADGTHQVGGTNAQLASDRFQMVEQAAEAAVPANVTADFESQMDAYFEGAQW
jgi:hypothetical protein